jgi:hypothetical protein
MRNPNLILSCLLMPFFLLSHTEENQFEILKQNGIPVAINPDHPIPIKEGPGDIVFIKYRNLLFC